MIIPSSSVASSDDEALRGLLLSTLTALMKASKTNSVSPLTFLFRERLKDKKQRKELNRALFAMTTSLAKKVKKNSSQTVVKGAAKGDIKQSVNPIKDGVKTGKVLDNIELTPEFIERTGWFDNTGD